jgi:hypothetical protein
MSSIASSIPGANCTTLDAERARLRKLKEGTIFLEKDDLMGICLSNDFDSLSNAPPNIDTKSSSDTS